MSGFQTVTLSGWYCTRLLGSCILSLVLVGCVTPGVPMQSSDPVSRQGTVTLVLHTSVPGKVDVGTGRIVAASVAFFAGVAAPSVGMAVADNGTLRSNVVGFFAGSKTGDVIRETGRDVVSEEPAEAPPRIAVIQVYVHLDSGKETSAMKPGDQLEGYAEGDRVVVQLNKDGDAETIQKIQ
jgi:hypothetical protein